MVSAPATAIAVHGALPALHGSIARLSTRERKASILRGFRWGGRRSDPVAMQHFSTTGR